MAGGSWNGYRGDTPALFDAWSRLYLGFNDAVPVSGLPQTVPLPSVQDHQAGSVIRLDGANSQEYWLLENRRQIGSDAALPSAGLLIWHVDEAAAGNDAECRQADNYSCSGSGRHYLVALEQADGLYQLENGANQGNAGDPFPGSTGKRRFDFGSNPNSSSYYVGTDLGREGDRHQRRGRHDDRPGVGRRPACGPLRQGHPGGRRREPALSTWSCRGRRHRGPPATSTAIDPVDDGTCAGSWVNAGTATQVALTGLGMATTYFWQVRAAIGAETAYADGGAWWSFTTGGPPAAFGKARPASGATGQPLVGGGVVGSGSGGRRLRVLLRHRRRRRLRRPLGGRRSGDLGRAVGTRSRHHLLLAGAGAQLVRLHRGRRRGLVAVHHGQPAGRLRQVETARGGRRTAAEPHVWPGRRRPERPRTSTASTRPTMAPARVSGRRRERRQSASVGPLAVGTTYFWQVRAAQRLRLHRGRRRGLVVVRHAAAAATDGGVDRRGATAGSSNATRIPAGAATVLDALGATGRLGDDAADRQYRSILDFDTTGPARRRGRRRHHPADQERARCRHRPLRHLRLPEGRHADRLLPRRSHARALRLPRDGQRGQRGTVHQHPGGRVVPGRAAARLLRPGEPQSGAPSSGCGSPGTTTTTGRPISCRSIPGTQRPRTTARNSSSPTTCPEEPWVSRRAATTAGYSKMVPASSILISRRPRPSTRRAARAPTAGRMRAAYMPGWIVHPSSTKVR